MARGYQSELREQAKAETRELIPQVQRWLIGLMGELATPPGLEERYATTHKETIGAEQVTHLDELAARLEAGGAMQFKGWALPIRARVISGASASPRWRLCRWVCGSPMRSWA